MTDILTGGLPSLVEMSRKDVCTPALQKFFHRHTEIFDFFFFGVHLASRTDEMRFTALRALAGPDRPDDEERLREAEKNPWPTMLKLREFAILQSENMCIRSVDNFVSYLSDIIQLAMRSRPELLRSEETVRLDEIVRFSRYSDLIAYLVDKKINELTYGGIRGIERFVQKRTGLNLFENSNEKTYLMLAIELRNIFSHNRGLVGDITLKRLADFEHGFALKQGTRPLINIDQLLDLSNNMATVALRLDGAFAAKFSIRRRRFAPVNAMPDRLESHL